MRHALTMHKPDRIYQLREVKMRNVLSNTLIGFDLVEEIPSFSEFHGYPYPMNIIARAKKLNYILMLANVFVQRDLHVQLLLADAALPDGMVLVDELDSDEWLGAVERCGFADTALRLALHILPKTMCYLNNCRGRCVGWQ